MITWSCRNESKYAQNYLNPSESEHQTSPRDRGEDTGRRLDGNTNITKRDRRQEQLQQAAISCVGVELNPKLDFKTEPQQQTSHRPQYISSRVTQEPQCPQKSSRFRQPVTTRLQTLRCTTPVREKIRQFKQLYELQRLQRLYENRSAFPSVFAETPVAKATNAKGDDRRRGVVTLPTADGYSNCGVADMPRRKYSPTTSWRTWRDVNRSDVYDDVEKYIDEYNLMPSDKRQRIEQWIEYGMMTNGNLATVSSSCADDFENGPRNRPPSSEGYNNEAVTLLQLVTDCQITDD